MRRALIGLVTVAGCVGVGSAWAWQFGTQDGPMMMGGRFATDPNMEIEIELRQMDLDALKVVYGELTTQVARGAEGEVRKRREMLRGEIVDASRGMVELRRKSFDDIQAQMRARRGGMSGGDRRPSEKIDERPEPKADSFDRVESKGEPRATPEDEVRKLREELRKAREELERRDRPTSKDVPKSAGFR